MAVDNLLYRSDINSAKPLLNSMISSFLASLLLQFIEMSVYYSHVSVLRCFSTKGLLFDSADHELREYFFLLRRHALNLPVDFLENGTHVFYDATDFISVCILIKKASFLLHFVVKIPSTCY